MSTLSQKIKVERQEKHYNNVWYLVIVLTGLIVILIELIK